MPSSSATCRRAPSPPPTGGSSASLSGPTGTWSQATLPDLDPSYRAFYTRGRQPAGRRIADPAGKQGDGRRAPASARDLAARLGADGRRGHHRVLEGGQPVRPTRSSRQASNVAWSTNLQLIVTGGIGLLLVIFSIVVAILTARSLVRELGSLRQSALTLANERLPEVVDRPRPRPGRRTSPPRPRTSQPPPTRSARVRDAFATVQQTAVRAAVGQARLRPGHEARSSATWPGAASPLLHRQLALLDAMGAPGRGNPQELEDLFRIDHLTTRMRRHAERPDHPVRPPARPGLAQPGPAGGRAARRRG